MEIINRNFGIFDACFLAFHHFVIYLLLLRMIEVTTVSPLGHSGGDNECVPAFGGSISPHFAALNQRQNKIPRIIWRKLQTRPPECSDLSFMIYVCTRDQQFPSSTCPFNGLPPSLAPSKR